MAHGETGRGPTPVREVEEDAVQRVGAVNIDSERMLAMMAAIMQNTEQTNQKMDSNTEQLNQNMSELSQKIDDNTRRIMEAQKQYTDEKCEALKEEMREEIRNSCGVVKEEVKEIKNFCEIRRAEVDYQLAELFRVVQAQGVAVVQVTERLGTEVNEEAGAAALHTPPPSPGRHLPSVTGPRHLKNAPASPHAPASHLPAPAGPRKPAEFDGKVQWDAYYAQFHLLADVQGWDDTERALQLVERKGGEMLELKVSIADDRARVHLCKAEGH